MVQRSISPCFFGNKVTMAFKLIFVFAVITVFAVNALNLRPCVRGQNKLELKKLVKKSSNTLVGEYRVVKSEWFNPNKYEMSMNGKTFKGRFPKGCNFSRWLESKVTCGSQVWRWFRLKPNMFKDVKFTLKLFSDKELLACFKNN